MHNKTNIRTIENFFEALRPKGSWTLTAIYKKADGPPDLPMVYTTNRAEIQTFFQIHEGENLYYQANETKPVWKNAPTRMEWGRLDADHGIVERADEYHCEAHR